MLLPLISLLLFGLTFGSSLLEGHHKSAERLDTASRTSSPTRMHRDEQSLSSDPTQGYHDFMRRRDDTENFDNLLQHGPSDFILRPLQMLDFSRDIVSFMAKSENENEKPMENIIEKMIRFGGTMENMIKDSFDKHDRYRRGAKDHDYDHDHNYGYPVIDTPAYIAAPENSYPNRHCYLLAPQIHENDHSSKGGHHGSNHKKDDHGESNNIVICEISEHSCPCQDEHNGDYVDESHTNGQIVYDTQRSNGNYNGQYRNNRRPLYFSRRQWFV